MKAARSWVVLLATLIGVGTTVSLGCWQLRRAQAKLDRFETMQSRERLAPLDTAQLPCWAADWQAGLQRLVRLKGHWLPEYTFFLDNRPMNDRAGRFVLTPLRLAPDAGPGQKAGCAQDVVLVQRGWVPRDARDRTRVPAIGSAEGLVVVTGRLSEAPSALFELGANASAPVGVIRQNVDVGRLASQWRLGLRPGSIVQLAEEQPSAPQEVPLQRDWWKPQADVGKHHAYAAQWFAMSAVMVFLYVWFQWWRPRKAAAA